MTRSRRLCLGLPKGTLQDTTVELFARAGYDLRISEYIQNADITAAAATGKFDGFDSAY